MVQDYITNMIFQICDGETIFNKKIEITQEILDNRIVIFNDYPVSIFGIVKEYIDEDIGDMSDASLRNAYLLQHPTAIIEEKDGEYIAKFGLDFTQDQIDNIFGGRKSK